MKQESEIERHLKLFIEEKGIKGFCPSTIGIIAKTSYADLINLTCNLLEVYFEEHEDEPNNKNNECKHRDENGELTIEYDSAYEMRNNDMHCTQCHKEGSRYEFENDLI